MIKSFDTWIQTYRKFGIKPGLDTVKRLLDLLGNPQDELKVIHIAGTNGKGTSATLFHNILVEAGYKTALFMSPYLKYPEEMCVINDQEVKTSRWLELADSVENKIEIMRKNDEILPTEYEIYAAMMYLYFKEEAVDFAVVEVAMGGKNDCTNVIKSPLLTMITAIDLDHENFLGDTLEKIAMEKSGIIKENSPLVLHPQHNELVDFFSDLSSNMSFDLIDFKVDDKMIYDDFTMKFEYDGLAVESLLLGKHQKQNIIGVLEGIKYLRDKGIIKIDNKGLLNSIKNTSIPCRFEKINDWIFDGAHNNASLLALKRTLDRLKLNNLIGVIGVLGDKDNLEGFKALKSYFKEIIVVEPANERKCSNEALERSLRGLAYENIISAKDYDEVIEIAHKRDHMKLAFGSFYMVGPLRERLKALL